MRIKRNLAVTAAAFLLLAGCDTTAFDYPFDTPDMPTYVAFDAELMPAAGRSHDPAQPELGTQYDLVAGANRIIPLRLPVALGENVTVSYSITGDAVLGEDFVILVNEWVQDPDPGYPEGFRMVPVTPANYVFPEQPNEFTIFYSTEVAESIRRLVAFVILEGATPGRSFQIELTDATTPGGHEIVTGRLPANRDRILTFNIAG